jgi:hypothetical protein
VSVGPSFRACRLSSATDITSRWSNSRQRQLTSSAQIPRRRANHRDMTPSHVDPHRRAQSSADTDTAEKSAMTPKTRP